MNELRAWTDELLGRITMYRQVIYALSTVAVFALIFMVTGYLSYSPLAFIISIAILVASSYVSNRLFGWLFGVRPYAESAIITGLILSLIFSPAVTVLAGVKLVLVAIFASLSKYLFAVRGKHIFNPAAIATVIASVSGLAYATWWVATPALLPVTAIVAFLILYKTEKLRMALAFLGVSIVIITALAIQHGQTSPAELMAALTSWPLVFFAGIMLSEPQTLAPRRQQQIIIAVIVAVLLTLDIHYGRLSMTPALALVIGNAISFTYGIRRGLKLRLVSVKKHARDGYEFVFDTPAFGFLPGQYVEVSLPHHHADSRGIRRVFSIIGQPGETQLSIATRIPERPSSFKKALLALKPGDTVHPTRVAGDFVLPSDKNTPIVCIAGGIGVTPFLSFLQATAARKITLLYSVTSLEDLMFVDQLKHYESDIVIVSPDQGKVPDPEWRHEVSRLTSDVISRYVDASTHVYLSGPPAMVMKTKELVEHAGAKAVSTDEFAGY